MGEEHSTRAATESVAPCVLPSRNAPSKSIWPPIQGRLALGDVLRESVQLETGKDGRWHAVGANWDLRTTAVAYPSQGAAWRDLRRWIEWHDRARPLLSRRRALAVVGSGDQTWFLWQVVHRVRSVHEAVSAVFALCSEAAAAAALLDGALALSGALDRLSASAGPWPRIDAKMIAMNVDAVPFVAMAPDPGSADASQPSLVEALDADLAPIARRRVEARALDPSALDAALCRRAAEIDREPLGEMLRDLL